MDSVALDENECGALRGGLGLILPSSCGVTPWEHTTACGSLQHRFSSHPGASGAELPWHLAAIGLSEVRLMSVPNLAGPPLPSGAFHIPHTDSHCVLSRSFGWSHSLHCLPRLFFSLCGVRDQVVAAQAMPAPNRQVPGAPPSSPLPSRIPQKLPPDAAVFAAQPASYLEMARDEAHDPSDYVWSGLDPLDVPHWTCEMVAKSLRLKLNLKYPSAPIVEQCVEAIHRHLIDGEALPALTRGDWRDVIPQAGPRCYIIGVVDGWLRGARKPEPALPEAFPEPPEEPRAPSPQQSPPPTPMIELMDEWLRARGSVSSRMQVKVALRESSVHPRLQRCLPRSFHMSPFNYVPLIGDMRPQVVDPPPPCDVCCRIRKRAAGAPEPLVSAPDCPPAVL